MIGSSKIDYVNNNENINIVDPYAGLLPTTLTASGRRHYVQPQQPRSLSQ